MSKRKGRINRFDSTKLREIRESRKMTRREVCEATGFGLSRLTNWELGIAPPSVEDLFTLLELYQVSLFDMRELADRGKMEADK